MTTVAWDGSVLAADRMGTVGGTPMLARKVYRLRAPNGRWALVGFTGNMSIVPAYLHWLHGGAKPDFRDEKYKWAVLMIDDRRNMYIRSNDSDYWDRLRGLRYFALGSGSDYALGAMAAGALAPAAVRVAAKLDADTGMGVDVVRLP